MQKRKKILYVVTKSVWGGAQRYVYDLALGLPREQCEVIVTAGGNGLLHERLKISGIRTISLPSLQRSVNPLRDGAVFFHLLKIFVSEKPDVIHLSSPKAGLVGGLAAFFYKTLYPKPYTLNPRIIYTVHGWPFQEDRMWLARAAIFLGCWFSSLFHDHIILINKNDLRIASFFLPRHKLALIPNGIHAPNFLARTEARAALENLSGRSFNQNTLLIGTITELTKNKGLPYLIETVDQIKSQISNTKSQIIVIGDGLDRKKLEAEIRKRNLEKIISLAGFIPDAAKYLKAFDLFVLPSVKEGLPYAALEAMAAGVPIIASRVGGLPDIISDSTKGILVPPKNIPRLAEALLQSIQSSIPSPTLDSRFSFANMAESTKNLYL